MCRGVIGQRQWTPGRSLSRRKVSSAPCPNRKAKVLVGRRVHPLISEKVWGKRAAIDELARKKKTVSVSPHKPGGISLGGDQTIRMQSAAMSEWSDDDGF